MQSTSSIGLFAFALVVGAALTVMVGSPVFGWFPVVRMSAVVGAILVVSCFAARPWGWTEDQWWRLARWVPSEREVISGSSILAAVLFWLVYSRFQAGGIDAVDFTVYFDRPLYQTSLGRILFVESTDDPRFAQLTHLAVHGYWILVPLAALYWVYPSPLWLLCLSVLAVTGGALCVFRVVRRCGAPGLVGAAAAMAFVFNGNTARALNYGFHAEILYAFFIPWAIDAGLRRARVPFMTAVLACLLVKEDAIFPLLGLSAALAFTGQGQMNRAERVIFLVAPPTLALGNLAAFYGWVVPALAPDGKVMYSYFWATSGPTPWHALVALLLDPVRLVRGAITSGFFSLVLSGHLYLPLLGWRWIIGLLPVVLVYGAADNQQVRQFGIYYAVPLVPFLTIGTTEGARRLTRVVLRGPVAEVASAVVVLTSALSIGLGYSLRPWKHELRVVPLAVAQLGSHDGVNVLVQGGLYPHAGYARNVQLLTNEALHAQESDRAVMLLASRGSAYPLSKTQLKCLTSLPALRMMPHGLIAVRVTEAARQCVVSSGESAARQHPKAIRQRLDLLSSMA